MPVKFPRRISLIVCSVGGVLALPLAAVPIQNSSFETPTVDSGTFASLVAPPWVLTGTGTLFEGTLPVGAGVFTNPPDPGGPAPASGPYSNGHLEGVDGAQAAYVFSNAGNSITQALFDPAVAQPITFAAENSYTLTTAVALASFAPAASDRLAMELYYTDTGGTHVVAQSILTANTSSPALSQQTMQDYSFSTPFLSAGDPAVGQQINVGFFALDNGPESITFPPITSNGEFDIDNVRLASAVPEPAMMGLVGIASVLGLRRRRTNG